MEVESDPVENLVVVGVDGSDQASEAVRRAVEQARLLAGALEVCAFWHVPPVSGRLVTHDYHQVADAAREALEKALCLVGELDSRVETRGMTERKAPGPGLVKESAGARLLVIGSRGLGGFRGLLLGSVGRYCAEHARCPVLIVRPRPHHDGPRNGTRRHHARPPGGQVPG
jgi:nucleotide-binding universal stress UspA family protein